MTPSLYNFVWRIIRPFIPLLLWYRIRRGKDLRRLRIERYGRTAQRITPPGPHCAGRIWLHAVSVGESVTALRLARALATHYPDHAFLITTNTITGHSAVLAGIADQPDIAMQCAMQPLDHPDFVDHFLASWQPSAAIFMESDFWPNLILRSRQRGIPVIFASSQLSAKAVAGWMKRPALAQPLFAAAELILPVDAQQADQFRALIGTAHNIPRIQVIGSLKLPNRQQQDRKQQDPQLQRILQQAASGRRVFLAASTHDGEDQIVIDAASDLGADWLTIIAPRHPDRGDAIAAHAGQPPQRSHGAIPDSQTNLYIMDSLGEMGTLFSLADYVFLGGSLVPAGGHNPLEPAEFGLPILTGAHIFKNKAEFDGLAAAGAVFEVADAATITHQIRQLENDPARRAKLAKAAQDYVTIAHQRVALAAQAIKQVLTTVR